MLAGSPKTQLSHPFAYRRVSGGNWSLQISQLFDLGEDCDLSMGQGNSHAPLLSCKKSYAFIQKLYGNNYCP